MAIKFNNIIVGGEVKTSLHQPVKEKVKQKVKVEDLAPTVTKELPKYVEKEDGILVRKINTKSNYMRDIFELDS